MVQSLKEKDQKSKGLFWFDLVWFFFFYILELF